MQFFAVIKSFNLHPGFFRTYVGIAFLAFSLHIIGNLGWLESASTPLTFITQGIYSAYLGVAIYLIFREIYTATRITLTLVLRP